MDAPITSLICGATALVSVLAFSNTDLKHRFLFVPYSILVQKQWYRLFSGALIHADFTHLLFNLITIYSFGEAIEFGFGPVTFLSIYALSVLGGSLLSLYVHRHHDYSALGASGGACGVLFAAIFLLPGSGVGMYFLPFSIPGPLYAVLFLVGTFIALRRGKDNIGHDAHFGGAVVGLVTALILTPQNCFASPLLFACCSSFSAVGLYVICKAPLRLVEAFNFSLTPAHRPSLRYQRYDEARKQQAEEAEIDRILEKISQRGLQSLSSRERAKLHEASSKVKRS